MSDFLVHRSALSRYSHRQYQTAAKRQDNKRRLAEHRSPSGKSGINEPEGLPFPVQNPGACLALQTQTVRGDQSSSQ